MGITLLLRDWIDSSTRRSELLPHIPIIRCNKLNRNCDQPDVKRCPERCANSNRSVYLPIVRDLLPNALAVIDHPDASHVCGAREVTNVPAQALAGC